MSTDAVTSVEMEEFGPRFTAHEARVLAYVEESSTDELSARTIWLAHALPRGSAGRLELEAHELVIGVGELTLELARRLDRMLRGGAEAPEPLGSAEREICRRLMDDGDGLVGDVQLDDVVVLYDPLTAMLAESVRERGAHAVLHVDVDPAMAQEPAARAQSFLDAYTRPVHAYLLSRPRGVAAIIPSRRECSDCLGWASALTEVIREDRTERVGGVLHARPSVAAR
jgi:hypothetical protein